MSFHGPSHTILRGICAGAVCALATLAACAGTGAPPEPPIPSIASVPPPPVVAAPATVPPPAPPPDHVNRVTVVAAWYGKELHGKKTASGEVFDMYGLSAAHRTFPLGTTIRVTNLDNSRSVNVKINDRGPFVKGRGLDVSYGAAKELGFVEQGTARVMIESVDAAHGPAQYTVQAATFAEEESARQLKERLSRKFERVFIVPLETSVSRFYRVRVGSYGSEERAEQVAGKLALEGLEPVVVRRD